MSVAKLTSLPTPVLEMIDRFAEYKDAQVSSENGGYNETQLRVEFLDSLFGLQGLGWDIDNQGGLAETYKDVIHEDAIKIGGVTKAPDYCFRIGGVRKFFLETKRPSINIQGDLGPAYQLRRYAWSAKLPVSILSDFQAFAVYDCRIKPAKGDKPSVGRVMYFTYDQLADHWDELFGIFFREAVLEGSLDKYARSLKSKRGTSEVDTAFLEEIEDWRDSLARNLVLLNNDLGQRDLNLAVQRTIDRIIFLRICEDRGVEQYGTLRSLTECEHVYDRLFERFRRADERYKSGLFHFNIEKGRPQSPDDLTPGLRIDDKTLIDILARLYYPDSPYEFSVLPADILGHVYEQFLGNIIRLDEDRQTIVEKKPEVRKVGGVFYTPTYIVDYIVKHTVGRLVEGKTPQEVAGLTDLWQPSKKRQPITVLDPACGSGSFLLGAYQFLLDWYREKYIDDGPEKHTAGKSPRLYQQHRADGDGGGEYRLTTTERKRILTSHIYGVDIDSQAVETTKLSLLLKVLEGESAETLGSNLKLFHERALPDLADNIKCGNSLIGPDFYTNQQDGMYDQEKRLRVSDFDWEAEFESIMGNGGFDAVIGNPPYLSYSGRQAVAITQDETDYFAKHYLSGGWPTAHGLFVERAVSELSRNTVGMIVPDQIGHLDGYEHVRTSVAKHSNLVEVRYWGENVFDGVVTPALTFITHNESAATTICDKKGRTQPMASADGKWVAASERSLLSEFDVTTVSLEKLVADPGVHTGNCSKKLILPLEGAGSDVVPVLEGKQVSRYACSDPPKGLDLGYKAAEGEYFSIRPIEKYTNARFVIRQTAAYPIVGPRRHADYFRNSLLALYDPPQPFDVRYYVGLLNSRLIQYCYYKAVQESHQTAFPQVKVRSLRALPILMPDMSDISSRTMHDGLVEQTQLLLDLNERLAEPCSAHEKTVISRCIKSAEAESNRLVYEGYKLDKQKVQQVEEYIDDLEGN